MTSPSDGHLDVLRRVAIADQPLVRRAGGFWCVADSVDEVLKPRAWTRGEFSVGIQTVRTMERRGYLVRVGRAGQTADMFDDPRVITDLGRQVVAKENH